MNRINLCEETITGIFLGTNRYEVVADGYNFCKVTIKLLQRSEYDSLIQLKNNLLFSQVFKLTISLKSKPIKYLL